MNNTETLNAALNKAQEIRNLLDWDPDVKVDIDILIAEMEELIKILED